jgi:outer membrane protein assembly factor BamB
MRFAKLMLVLLFFAFVVNAENWPQFRGSNASGKADGNNIPESWNIESKANILWSTEIPGVGHSSPIVWGDRIFLTTAIGYESNWHDDSVEHTWKIFSIDAETGKILWDQTAYKGLPRAKRHEKSSQANSTPVTDGKYVAAIMGSEGLFVYDFNGKLVWKKDLGLLNPGLASDNTSQWGYASSPIIYKNMLIIQIDKHENSYLAAFNVEDGKEIWKTPRPDELPSWSTPTIYNGKNHTEILTNGQFFRGYDVQNGKEMWRFKDAAEVKQPTPLADGDTLIFAGGYPRGRPFYALRAGATGDITLKEGETKNNFLVWKIEKGGPYTPTQIVYKGYLYSVQNNGVLTSYDIQTGEKKYETKLDGDYSASPVASDDNLFFASEDGVVSVVKAGPEFKLVSKNDMDSPCYATPAIANRVMYLRTLDTLYAIGKKDSAQ